jgi:hypothetical protein
MPSSVLLPEYGSIVPLDDYNVEEEKVYLKEHENHRKYIFDRISIISNSTCNSQYVAGICARLVK